MTTVYNYCAATGRYLNSGDATIDPIEGKPLVPAHSTTAAPPKTSKNEAAIYVDGRWKVVPDYRGIVYWLADGSVHEINNLGVMPPGDALYKEPKLPPSEAIISSHIYTQYPPQKQSQDDKWSLSYTAKLKAAGVPKLEATVVHIIYLVSQGQALEKLITNSLATWPDDVYKHVSGSSKAERKAYATHMLTKLVKIGLRTEWAEACIRVGKAAIAAGAEPDFPPLLKM